MSTLTTLPVAELLPRLFEDAARTDRQIPELLGGALPPPEERARLMADPSWDYRAFYRRTKELHLAVSPETGRLLYVLARTSGARSIVEFGTSFGLSTIYLASALRDNGGGRLVGTDLEPEKIATARANLAAAGLEDLVELREGDALETLSRDLPESIDLVLLDGHKPLYTRILDLLEPRLRAGACIVADNVEMTPPYLARVRGSTSYVSVPFSSEVEVSMKL
jgi:predicted O-methyltransferase YrrM